MKASRLYRRQTTLAGARRRGNQEKDQRRVNTGSSNIYNIRGCSRRTGQQRVPFTTACTYVRTFVRSFGSRVNKSAARKIGHNLCSIPTCGPRYRRKLYDASGVCNFDFCSREIKMRERERGVVSAARGVGGGDDRVEETQRGAAVSVNKAARLAIAEAAMRVTLREVLRQCRTELRKTLAKRDRWVKEWPGQPGITSTQIQWTSDCTQTLQHCK